MSRGIARPGRPWPVRLATPDRRVDVDAGDGLLLHVEQSGQGPAIVLLHGFTGSSASWAILRAALDPTYTTLAVDLPGHGRSSSPSDTARYALTRVADDIVRVLDALELDRVALLGYSMGGRAALRVTLAHPDRVAALVLESTSPGIEDPVRRAERLAADLQLATSIERDGVDAFVARWEDMPMWTSQRSLPDSMLDAQRTQRRANDALGLANSLRGAGAGVDESVMHRLAGLTVRSLVVVGALDEPYVALGRSMQQALPDARLTVVPGSGHAVHLERSVAFADAVLAFLAGVPSVGARWP